MGIHMKGRNRSIFVTVTTTVVDICKHVVPPGNNQHSAETEVFSRQV
jgi:hypothetical protein